MEETFPHAADTYDTDWAQYTTEDTNTDVATYPVVYSQAGELTENLMTHHDNNAAGLHSSPEVACWVGAKHPAPLLMVVAHGELEQMLTMEDTFHYLINAHGQIKSTTEITSVQPSWVHGSCHAVSCHPNVVGVDGSGMTGEDYILEIYSTFPTSQMVSGQWDSTKTPGMDHFMFDGIRTCDHTYAIDSVDVYARASKHSVEGGELQHPNPGLQNGPSACETTEVVKKAIGKDPKAEEVLCCVGDLVTSTVGLEKTCCAMGRQLIYS